MDEVMFDICIKEFMEGYYNWTAHGEAQVIEYYDDPPAPVLKADRPGNALGGSVR
ncbi:UNVERIFIED_CONTAM: hypothetical protein Slati_2488000 [Sesamum latifolium]|uniref:Uncharacterized protein n=1 Tax=Sesamum latifolium TaxID=2727402 RepID=A0AAW2WE29_9LAMI